jgi:hypothetical protein
MTTFILSGRARQGQPRQGRTPAAGGTTEPAAAGGSTAPGTAAGNTPGMTAGRTEPGTAAGGSTAPGTAAGNTPGMTAGRTEPGTAARTAPGTSAGARRAAAWPHRRRRRAAALTKVEAAATDTEKNLGKRPKIGSNCTPTNSTVVMLHTYVTLTKKHMLTDFISKDTSLTLLHTQTYI